MRRRRGDWTQLVTTAANYWDDELGGAHTRQACNRFSILRFEVSYIGEKQLRYQNSLLQWLQAVRHFLNR